NSRGLRSGLRAARFFASISRHFSISSRNAASTVAVPFPLRSANLSNEPCLIAFGEKVPAMSSPACCIIRVRNEQYACRGRLVGDGWLDAAIVNGEFLEIRQDGERQSGGPRVAAAELVGGRRVVFEADGRLLRFQKEFGNTAKSKAIIGRFGRAADLD